MIKLFFKLKTAAFLLLFTAFVFGVVDLSKDGVVRNIEIKNIEAAEMSCEGPAAVVLVIDRSATMVDGEKFGIVKTASINFIDQLFSISAQPDIIYSPNDYHQIGLVAFNNSPDSKPLNKNEDDFMQGVIDDSNGILGDAYPLSYRGMADAIDEAKDILVLNINPFATKTMIVLTDGSPHYSIDDAIANANSAKDDKEIRIISVGLKLDNILDETERTKAEGFIKNIASVPSDCYYASDSGGVLEGCTSISADNLTEALGEVYSSITAAICDESPPTISISRKPSGTLYNVDNLTIMSTATDDIGFKSHLIIWGDDNTQVECADLIGTTISCDTGGLDPFGVGETITYRSIAMDANDNEVNIDPPQTVTVADVDLTVPALLRNKNNIIEVVVYNYGGNDNISISIDAPSLTGIEKELMSCSDSGSTRTCVYDFDTKDHGDGCLDWTDVITDGAVNNINVDVYIYAESGDMGTRQIASAEDRPLVSYFEGKDWAGTCSDGINNNCNYDESNNPIIDADEMLCDIAGPDVGILRNPSGDIYDFEEDGETPMQVTFESTAGDLNGIKQHTINYRENGGIWQIFDCSDVDPSDGKIVCNETEMFQSIATISVTISSFTAGTIVDYYSTAIDYSGNNNITNMATESFIVRNRSCFGEADLNDCVGMIGKCCGGVCNATISNPKNYNTNCAQETCGDALEYEEDVRVVRGDGRAISFDGVDDYINIPSVNPTEAITVSAWVKSASDTGYSGYRQIVSKYNAYILGTSGTGGNQICFIIHSGGTWKEGSCYVVPDPQEWHHFTGTYDKQTGEKNLYVDGILRDTTNFVGSINSDEGPVNIGRREGYADYYFNGSVDEVYVYGRALNLGLGEIENLRDGNAVSSADLDGYWSFDEEFGDVVHDNSGNGNLGTLNNFPTPIVRPGILWQWTVDGGKNGASCDIGGDSDGCYSLMTNGGCEERAYSCSAGYCSYGSDENKDHCEGEIFYNFGCAGNFCELNPNPPKEDPICDVTFGVLSLNAYDSDYEFDGEGALISGSSGTTTGGVLDNKTNTILLKSTANDPNGISEQKIYWKKEGDADFIVKDDCVVPCGDDVDCICEENIGPFNIGDVIKFYVTSKDNSPSQNEETTITYSFTVFDNQCYNINDHMNEDDLTPCASGKCCGGICDTLIENPLFYHEDCRKESCTLTSWDYAQDNGGGSCGSTDSCLNYYSYNNGFYSGCITGGNKCSSGYCDASLSLISAPSCNGNLLTNYSCNPDNETGTCQPKDSDVDCSLAGVYDGDAIACNCDCDNYDIEEKVYSSLSFDGADDYVEILDDSNLNISDEISVEVWVKDITGTGNKQDADVINDNDFVSKIRATVGTGENDGDYDKLSLWEAAIESDLTLATSQIFTVSDRGTYDYLTDDGQAITFTGGGTGILKHLNTSNKVYIVAVTGTVNTGIVVVDSSAHTFTISDTGQQIGRAIAECYNDWPAGLNDRVKIDDWTTNADNYVKVYTPISERHNGILKDESGDYTGFALRDSIYVVSSQKTIEVVKNYTVIDGLIVVAAEQWIGYGIKSDNDGSVIKNNIVYREIAREGIIGSGITFYNTSGEGTTVYNNIVYGSTEARWGAGLRGSVGKAYNNTVYLAGCGINSQFEYNNNLKNNIVIDSQTADYCGSTNGTRSNNISSDVTAPGADSLINQTFNDIAFISTTPDSENLHLQSTSVAIDAGADLSATFISDINGMIRADFWDIGADEYLKGAIVSKGAGGSAYSLTVDGDGNIYGNINSQNVSAQIVDNNWHQVVMTYNGNSQKIYLDGVEIESKSLIGSININADDLIIGKGSAGMIDEVRIYNRALYPEEIADHYNGIFADNTGLAGHWNFDEGTGETVKDHYDDTPEDNNSGTLKNGPTWMKHYHGSVSGANGNVPENWQVCTDGKDNDCDGVTNEYEAGISNCDGEVDWVEFTATAEDRSCVIDPGCVEGSDLFGAENVKIVDDIDIERVENDFTIKTLSGDAFLIKETMIEWTTDNWDSKNNKTCEGVGAEICEVSVCEEGTDCILSSSLSAGNTFSFRICAWDDSVNKNKKCTDDYSIIIENSNLAPEATSLLINDHNFCADGLEYVLNWTFSDLDGDMQKFYEIQIKEGNNDFSDPNELVVNVKKELSSSHYQILSADFINSKEMEYGNKIYYWRVRVTDSRSGGYEKTSVWVEYDDLDDSDGDGNSKTFTTPIHEYPQVDFSATPHYSEDCLYEVDYEFTGFEDECDYGEDITFSDSSTYANCDNPDNHQCITSTAVKCDTSVGFCVACSNEFDCSKFNTSVSYSCVAGICEPSGSCGSDADCRTADAAKCEIDIESEIGLCVACNDDLQCSNEKLGTTGIDYFCNSAGECDDKNHREWYFYGTDADDPYEIDPNPVGNYVDIDPIKSVVLKITDIDGNYCYETKNILLGGREYPKWNESPVF